MENNFSVTRIYADANGESHFENMSIALTDHGGIGSLSALWKVNGLMFREVDAAYNYDFHTAPQKQFIILLEGSIQIETSLGEIRLFGAGDILLVEDTAGKGHRTKNLQKEKRRSVFIKL
jgi:hypothetical protein